MQVHERRLGMKLDRKKNVYKWTVNKILKNACQSEIFMTLCNVSREFQDFIGVDTNFSTASPGLPWNCKKCNWLIVGVGALDLNRHLCSVPIVPVCLRCHTAQWIFCDSLNICLQFGLAGRKVLSHSNGACAHYVMVSKIQWKPFWLATQQDPQNDWNGWQNGVNHDVLARAPFDSLVLSIVWAVQVACFHCTFLQSVSGQRWDVDFALLCVLQEKMQSGRPSSRSGFGRWSVRWLQNSSTTWYVVSFVICCTIRKSGVFGSSPERNRVTVDFVCIMVIDIA